MRILVTGASGFVGRVLAPALAAAGHAVVVPPRHEADLADPAGYRPFIEGADAVVHLAAYNPPRWRVRRGDRARFAALNVGATAALGRMALQAGVRSFVFLSSARVYGIQDMPFYREDIPPRPADPYGASKWQAEQGLHEIYAAASRQLLILRAPVIYGPGRGGVLGLVERFARYGLPFPAPYARVPKSVLHAGNLASALRTALERPVPLSDTFNICDGAPATLGDLGMAMAAHHGRRFHTVPLPRILAHYLAVLPVLGPAAAHLAAPCVLDCGRFAEATGWEAPVSTCDAVAFSFARRSGNN